MKNLFKIKAMLRIAGVIALAAVIGFTMAGCEEEKAEAGIEGTWSQPNNTAIRFSGGNLQATSDITANNVNWTMMGTYTYNSPTLTINPPAQDGVVPPSLQGTAVVNGIQLTISGFSDIGINGNWTKQ